MLAKRKVNPIRNDVKSNGFSKLDAYFLQLFLYRHDISYRNMRENNEYIDVILLTKKYY